MSTPARCGWGGQASCPVRPRYEAHWTCGCVLPLCPDHMVAFREETKDSLTTDWSQALVELLTEGVHKKHYDGYYMRLGGYRTLVSRCVT